MNVIVGPSLELKCAESHVLDDLRNTTPGEAKRVRSIIDLTPENARKSVRRARARFRKPPT